MDKLNSIFEIFHKIMLRVKSVDDAQRPARNDSKFLPGAHIDRYTHSERTSTLYP